PRTMPAKNGSSKIRASVSRTTNAIDPVRRVTSERAAGFGTYPSRSMASSTATRASSETFGLALTTRLTVERDTPARAATCSSVGLGGRVVGLTSRVRRIGPRVEQPAEPVRGRLRGAFLRGAVDRDDPERRGVPLRPLEVVEQRP